ncbi:MAG: rhodanese-like domain-containing protein [Succinivibrionaceae bacterium]|nr:rhodanese-like domain-containing protein [Ruminobacter sp.]MEE1339902.1 rhodanese-like domain-containing protein [Succinivibrionaceae bacterium]
MEETLGISSEELINFAKNHYIVVAAWFICLGYVLWCQIMLWKDRIGYVDFNQATIDISHNGGAFVDIRKNEEFKKGHLNGAIDLEPSQILSGNVARLEKFKSNKIVVVSHTNDDTEAYNCAKALKKLGYQNTFLLRGGMLDLISQNIPLSKK